MRDNGRRQAMHIVIFSIAWWMVYGVVGNIIWKKFDFTLSRLRKRSIHFFCSNRSLRLFSLPFSRHECYLLLTAIYYFDIWIQNRLHPIVWDNVVSIENPIVNLEVAIHAQLINDPRFSDYFLVFIFTSFLSSRLLLAFDSNLKILPRYCFDIWIDCIPSLGIM